MTIDLSGLPTTGGYDVVSTPTQIHGRPDLGIAIATPEDLLARHLASLATYHKPAPWRCSSPVVAFVSANRWIFTCPHCRGGVSCGPAWPIGCCFECGAVFDQIAYPSDAAELEATLIARPGLYTRHWLPHESHRDLVAQNIDHQCHPGHTHAALELERQIRAQRAKAAP